MPFPPSELGGAESRRRPQDVAGASSGLRALGASIGLCWAALFVILASRYDLQLYGDGSLFSYAIATQDAWNFHWHNISGRLFVYLYAHLPAEAYLALTRDARAAVALYGVLFFSAPMVGLAATYAFDNTERRTLFAFACVSTACQGPLVFGFPTEMWFAHSIFWPLLALCHCAEPTWRMRMAVALGFTALVLTHGGGVIFAAAILATLALRGLQDPLYQRAVAGGAAAMAVWVLVQMQFRPDPYIAEALANAALNFIDLRNLNAPVLRLLACALVTYALVYWILRRIEQEHAHLKAAALVALCLAIYWAGFDRCLHSELRYPLRTALLVFTPLLGGLAAACALHTAGSIRLPIPLLQEAIAALKRRLPARYLAGALMLVTLVHAVETAKFVVNWSTYKQAVRDLAMSDTSNPELGSPRYTSAERIGQRRNLLAWGSTTHFLSVLMAPGLIPRRLVVDPETNYFWLSCSVATANMVAPRVVPLESRQLIRAHACKHR